MKRIIIGVLAVVLCAQASWAFLYNIKFLTKEEIQQMNDADLEERYIEARIEEKASQEFHIGAGFSSSKDYESRKKLLRYIFELRREIGRREKIEAEKLDGYLK